MEEQGNNAVSQDRGSNSLCPSFVPVELKCSSLKQYSSLMHVPHRLPSPGSNCFPHSKTKMFLASVVHWKGFLIWVSLGSNREGTS